MKGGRPEPLPLLRSVSVDAGRRPENRHDRLAAIVVEHRCSIRDIRTAQAFLAPEELSPRFAAATSPAPHSAGSDSASCKLLVADSIPELTDLLNRERDAGCFAQGRVWDLDAAWNPHGNFEIAEYRLSEAIEMPGHAA